MPSETTPLIQTVHVSPLRPRYPHQTIRRFCTIACASLVLLGFLFFLVDTLLVEPLHLRHGRSVPLEEVKRLLLETPNSDKVREWSRYYTSGMHLAGRNKTQAEWTREKWQDWGVQSSLEAYEVYINYPEDHGLRLLEQKKGGHDWDVTFEAALEEDILQDDPTTALKERVPTFHGYSASGNVTGSLVYVNYGTYLDYQDLLDAGIELKGKIAIARYGGCFRGLKVQRAQELGMLGVLIYSDPGDDGEMTEANGYAPYPEGPARQPSSVQRGSVQYLSTRPGDPTTPGYPSKPGVPRQPANESTPSIPSLPISYADALPLLRALNGHGPKSSDFNWFWQRNEGLGYKNVSYHIGPTPPSVAVNLYNAQNYTTTPQWDVIGIVNGTRPDDVLIVGNHRDAWIAGGAGDPNSGSAALNEVVRSVGAALARGWTPLRTIIFASWDGEEYGLVGSTEWVEEHAPWLRGASVAYLNMDEAATGDVFRTSAAPLLHGVLRAAARQVPSPNQTVPGQTVADLWDGHIGTMGSGSDFTAFQDYVGVPSLDFSFKPSAGSPVYHYHSNYDSFRWMDTYGDPGFRYHVAAAQLLGVMVAELSDSTVVPMRAGDYAEALAGYVAQVERRLGGQDASSAAVPGADTTDETISLLRGRLSPLPKPLSAADDAPFRDAVARLHPAVRSLTISAYALDARADAAASTPLPRWNLWAKYKLLRSVRRVNRAYKCMERAFVYDEGLDGRNWFKHVVFAPGLWTGYAGAVFPGLVESIDAQDWDNGIKWAKVIEERLEDAKAVLDGEKYAFCEEER